MTATNGPERVPQLLGERLAAGELDATRAQSVRARLAAEDGGEARLQAIARSDDEIRHTYATADMVAAIARKADAAARLDAARQDRAQRHRAPMWAWAGPLAAAALAMLVFVANDRGTSRIDGERSKGMEQSAPIDPQTAGHDDGHRAKGLQPHLQVFRKRGDDAERLADGDGVEAGDVLQLRYVATDTNAFGAIVSIDGRGEVTRHLPVAGARAEALEVGKAIALPHAYELDDAPDFERFVFITADRPFEIALILGAARDTAKGGARARTAALDLPPVLSQSSFVVEKVEP